MSEANEILPCPFCGKNADVMYSETRSHFRHSVLCNDGCLAEGPIATSDQEAIALWNRRAPPQPSQSQKG
jgi:Lar family restriction alleviation protein